MGTHFDTRIVEFQDIDGNPIKRTVSVPVDTEAFLDAVGIGRGIRKERLVLSSDKGVYPIYLSDFPIVHTCLIPFLPTCPNYLSY